MYGNDAYIVTGVCNNNTLFKGALLRKKFPNIEPKTFTTETYFVKVHLHLNIEIYEEKK